MIFATFIFVNMIVLKNKHKTPRSLKNKAFIQS